MGEPAGDGEGAYLSFRDGSRSRRLVNADANGCSKFGGGGVSKVASVATAKRIARAEIRLLERDADGNDADGVRKRETTAGIRTTRIPTRPEIEARRVPGSDSARCSSDGRPTTG